MDKLKKKPQANKSNKNIKRKENINFENLKNDLKKAKEDNLRYLAEIDNLTKRHDYLFRKISSYQPILILFAASCKAFHHSYLKNRSDN